MFLPSHHLCLPVPLTGKWSGDTRDHSAYQRGTAGRVRGRGPWAGSQAMPPRPVCQAGRRPGSPAVSAWLPKLGLPVTSPLQSCPWLPRFWCTSTRPALSCSSRMFSAPGYCAKPWHQVSVCQKPVSCSAEPSGPARASGCLMEWRPHRQTCPASAWGSLRTSPRHQLTEQQPSEMRTQPHLVNGAEDEGGSRL